MKKPLIFFGATLITILIASSVYAEGTADDYMRGMGTQIGRGLVNVVTSPAEIVCTTSTDIKDKGGAGFFTGFGKGTTFMLRRILVGVSEIATFVMPRSEAALPPVCKKPEAKVSS